MKSKRLLLTLLMALVVPWAAQAQTAVGDSWSDNFEGTSCDWELINGTLTNKWCWGTATNNGGTHAIYVSNDNGTTNAYNNGSYTMVYATKLLTFTEGKFEFSYDWIANGETNWDFLRVALVPSSVTLSAGTSLPSGLTYSAVPSGWIALDGGSQLKGVTAWQSKSVTINVTAGDYNLVMAWRNDGSGGTNPPAAIDNVSIRKIACDYDVENLAVSDITTSSASLTWTAGEASQWQVAYSINSNFEGATEGIGDEPSYNMTNLTANTTYYVRVRAYCGGNDFGAWTNLQFKTACNASDLANEDFEDDFDSYTGVTSGSINNLPDCWNYINGTTYSYYAGYPVIYNSSSYSHSGNNHLRFYSYAYYSGGTTTYDPRDQYAILPPMDNLAGKQITLWGRVSNANSSFKVGLMTNPQDANTFVEITNSANPAMSTSYQEFTYLIPTNATAHYVAIMMEAATQSATSKTVYIDDITISEVPTCFQPKNLAAAQNSVTTHGATLTWERHPNGTETAWVLQIATNSAFTEGLQTFEVSETPSKALTGLVAETQYFARVKPDCDTEGELWSDVASFTTEVACPAPTNLTVPTNSITANEATASWAGTSESYVVMIGEEQIGQGTVDFENQVIPAFFTNDATRPWTVTTGGADESRYCIIPGNKGVNSSQSNLTCEVTGPCTVSFKAKVSSESSWDKGYFYIDGTEKFNISGTQDWTAYSYELTEGTHTLNWRYTKDSSGASGNDLFYVDNISMPMPVVNSWTEYTTTETNYPFEGLTPNTAYQVKVKGNCGDEGYSQETAPVSFTTLPSCFAPTGLAIAQGYPTAHAVSFTWDYEAGEVFQYALVPGSLVNVQDVDDSYFNSPDWHAGEDFPIWNTLNADQDQSFFLRKKCGNTDFSEIVYIYVHTLVACPAPTNFAVAGLTGHTATLEWEGTSASYEVSYGAANTPGTLLSTGFEDNAIPTAFTNDATYPWTVTAGGANNSGYCAIPGNSGVNSSSSNLTYVTTGPGSVTFMAKVSSESGYDYGRFFIDGAQKMQISGTNDWTEYSYELTEGTHTLVWRYYKDSSTASGSDLFYVDNIVVTGLTVGEWITATTTEETITLQGLTPETPYQAYLRGDCDSEGYSTSVGPISFTTDVACPAPTGFALEQLKSDHVVLNWNAGADAWQIQINDNTVYTDIALEDVTINEGVATYTLNGLTENTPYTLKLRANCTSSNDGYSEWTSPLSFTTLENCPTPTDVEVTNIGHYSAIVSWTGNSDNFLVYVGHNEVAETYVSENFEQEVIPTSWTNESANPWVIAEGNGGFIMKSGNVGVHSSTSEISFTYTLTAASKIEFDALCQGEGTGTNYYDVSEFYIDDELQFHAAEQIAGWNHYSFDVTAGTHTFKWRYTKDSSVSHSGDAFSVDNVRLFKTNQVWNAPVTVSTDTYEIPGLEPGTEYIVKVSPDCDETLFSEVVSFTTRSANDKIFAVAGDWSTASNWIPTGAPTYEQTAELRANVIITGEAEAASINQGNYTITIEDGGKLKANTSVNAIVKKNIEPWTVDTDIENETLSNGWYLITNPITSNFAPTAENGFLVGDYDFYQFDFTMDPEEWRNREAGAFTTMNSSSYTSYGYLYANSQATTLTYSGNIKAANSALYKTAEAPTNQYRFSGWYLLGNGFMCDAYVATANTGGNALPFYKMNDDRNDFEAVAATSLTALAPMEGFFYQNSGTSSQTVYITTTAPEVQRGGQLNMNLRSSNKQLDNAILVFGGEQKLGKFSFREGSSKIYMPVEGKDLAITTAEGKVGEQPVSFKAEKNGTYSLSFTSQEVSFSYLHLIDNMTGNDVDLLANPSYSFDARTTDYESRFRLVFATGSSVDGDNFGFINGMGNLCIFGIDGTATVQVVDVTGRMLSSETFSGSYERKLNVAPGVYMIRLINGNDVKVQKMIVR